MQLTVLCDNTPHDENLAFEFGLSMHLTLSNGNTWLWDTGQTDVFLTNAQKLHISLDTVQGIALSHGHFDHGNGLASLTKDIPVYAHPNALQQRYLDSRKTPLKNTEIKEIGLSENVELKEIGLSEKANAYLKKNFHPVETILQLDEGLHMVTNIPRIQGNCEHTDNFYSDPSFTQHDPVPDDGLLVVEEDEGIVVIFGCCHSGLANSLQYVQKLFDSRPILTMIGGLHLMEGREIPIQQAIDVLKDTKATIYAGHCTGEKGYIPLREAIGPRVLPMGSGKYVEI